MISTDFLIALAEDPYAALLVSTTIAVTLFIIIPYHLVYYTSPPQFVNPSTIKKFAVFICSNNTTPTFEESSDANSTSSQNIINLLKDETKPKQMWSEYRLYKNEFPSTRELNTFSGIVVTGLNSGLHVQANSGESRWIKKAQTIIHYIHKHRKHTCKLLGIGCGHELIASSLSGKTGRNPNFGVDSGVRSLYVNTDFLRLFNQNEFGELTKSITKSKQLLIAELHCDAVIELPPNATCLASSDATEIEMFAVGQNVLSVQGHPEWKPTRNAMFNEAKMDMRDYNTWQNLFRTWFYSM